MLTRHFTSERINEIANHPSIYSWIKGSHEGYLDLKHAVANENNFYLVGEHGYISFHRQQPGIFEFHTCILPSGRGQWMLEGAKYAFRYMFTRTEAFELITRCPDGNIASKAGAKIVGMSQIFRTNANWPTDNGNVCCDVYSFILQNWIKQTPELALVGEEYHNKLQEEYNRIGKSMPLHEEDNTHNIYAGLAAELITNGQPLKGVLCYNRFARIAGYEPILVHSFDPLVIDIKESKLLVENGEFKVID